MKNQKSKAATKRGVVLESAVGRFLVVSSPKVDDPLKEVTGDIEGTFDTQEKAEAFIREDGRRSFNLDGANEGRNEDWCSAMFICKCVAVRKAIPIVSVRVEVVDAVPTPNPSHHDGAAPAPSVDGVVGSLNQEDGK